MASPVVVAATSSAKSYSAKTLTTAVGFPPQSSSQPSHLPPPVKKKKTTLATHTSGSAGQQQQKSVNISLEVLQAELKDISAKWYKLGSQLKIDFVQLEHIRKMNSNNPEKCLYSVLEEFMVGKTSAPWKKLCKALKSDIIGESSLSEHLKRKYGAANVNIQQKGELM